MPPASFPAPVKCRNLRDIVLGRFLGFLAIVFLGTLLPVQAVQSVTLAWNASPSSGIVSYKVYYGTVAGSPGSSVAVGNVTTATIPNLNDATTYYFSVSASNNAGLESQRSSEIAHTTPPSPTNTYTLTVDNGSGDGPYPAGRQVVVTADPAPSGQQFARWEGDYVILANPSSPTTSATIPLRNVAITATYSALAANSVSLGAGTGLRAEYYNNDIGSAYPLTNPFTGSPVLTRTDATVNFDWGQGSPAPAIGADNFSVKWTGQIRAPVSGSYTFTVTADDGVRLFLNGARVIDAWKTQSTSVYTYTMTLTAGMLYDIELHYYEQFRDAVCQLQWSYPGQAIQSIPTNYLYATSQVQPEETQAELPASGSGTGLLGQYYNDSSNGVYPLANPFTGSPVSTRTDAAVSFEWGLSSPAVGVNADNFSVRWTGRVRAPVTGSYTFSVAADDGVRLFLNGVRAIDGWKEQPLTAYSYTTNLTAGQYYSIEMHFFERGYRASCQLIWSYPGQAEQVIPQSQLYPN